MWGSYRMGMIEPCCRDVEFLGFQARPGPFKRNFKMPERSSIAWPDSKKPRWAIVGLGSVVLSHASIRFDLSLVGRAS